MGTVLLLNMPFVSLDRPSIGISLLKAELAQAGIECRTAYANLFLAERVGLEPYQAVDARLPFFLGDWLFSQQLFGLGQGEDAWLPTLRSWLGSEADLQLVRELQRAIGPYLEACIERFSIANYDVIGFTSTFQQNLASLALARMVKERFPRKVVVLGGANCEGPMGVELHRSFPWIDYVFSGEADESFPAFLRSLFAGAPVSSQGMVYRDRGETRSTPAAPLVHAMDDLPVPDYDDYFAALNASPLAGDIQPALLLESARGCWWGAKSHCTFCGLNGSSMAFRSKSAGRVLSEIALQKSRYGITHFIAVDNILPHNYFTELLPQLKQSGLGASLFYEIKSNVNRRQVQLLSESGVRAVQPGIESLNTHVLALMRKGVSGIQNVQLLKWCRELGVQVAWNLLYGFPGETECDYAEIAATIDAVSHLTPPCAVARIRLDRFSPYFNDPQAWGLANVRPFSTYSLVYPLPPERIANLAYFFEYDYADGRQPDSYAAKALQAAADWRQNRGGDLVMETGAKPDLAITDTRPGRPPARYELNGIQSEIYLHCGEARPLAGLRALAQGALGSGEEVDRWLASFLAQLIDFRLMLRENQRYLSLAVPATAAAA
jgi:ribosomal peptide maturation radical SAM protein 1